MTRCGISWRSQWCWRTASCVGRVTRRRAGRTSY